MASCLRVTFLNHGFQSLRGLGFIRGFWCSGRRKAGPYIRTQKLTRQDVNNRKPNVGATLAVALGVAPDNAQGTIPNILLI